MKIRLNIGGGFAKRTQLVPYLFKNKDKCKKFHITVFDGINNCSWNGGRINRDISYDDKTIDFYYRHNIGIALTFTNPIINLNDKIGNHLLEKFHRDDNYIISVNDDLRDYIKMQFPKYKHTRSITSFGDISVPMSDDDINRYKILEEKYTYIVPRTEHTFDDRFNVLDACKYEIMVNDTCIYNCPYYKEHFEMIAKQNSLYKRPWEEGGHDCMEIIEECWLPNFDPEVGHKPTIEKYGENYGMDLKKRQIQRLIRSGVTSFKITGREMTEKQYEGTMNYYLNMFMKDID